MLIKMGSEVCGIKSDVLDVGRTWMASGCGVCLWRGDVCLLSGSMQWASAMRRTVGVQVGALGSKVLGIMVSKPCGVRKKQLRESSWNGVELMSTGSV